MRKSLSDIDRGGRKKKRCLPRARINGVDGRERSAGFGGIAEVLSVWDEVYFPSASFEEAWEASADVCVRVQQGGSSGDLSCLRVTERCLFRIAR